MLFYAYEQCLGTDEHEAAGALLTSLLREHLPTLSEDCSLEHGDDGAPFLSNGKTKLDGIYISLSHSHGACAAAISDHPVGIDIELIRSLADREASLERRFLSRFEGICENDTPNSFFYRWTSAEAAFKAGGEWEPSKMEFLHKRVSLEGQDYILCVAQKTKE